MLVVVWEYRAWGELFRQSPAFVSITLMRDLKDPQRFMVADRWTSERMYEDFKRERAETWRELSERGARLHVREAEIGRFDFLN